VSRWLAGAFALVAVVGSAAAVWLVVLDGDDDGRPGRNTAQASIGEPAPDEARAGAAKGAGDATRFEVSVSGDLLMHQPLLDRALANGGGDEYDFAPFFKRIEPYLDGVEYALCHMETPMGPGPPATYPIFNTPTDLADSLARSGWDACSTASNHSLDQGQAGIDGTVEALHRAGLEHTGSFDSRKASGKPAILDVDGVKLGFVAYTDATNGLSAPHSWSLNEYSADDPKAGAKAIIRDARAARDAGADAVIVQLHWGDEYAQSPNSSQIAVAKKLTDAKVVSVVVGQGPHVVQPIERVNGKFVVFSEGNLVSNQGAASGTPTATQDGFVGLLHFRAKGDRVTVRRVTYVPTWVSRGDYVVIPVKPSSDSYRRTVAVVGKGEGFGPER
jgi:poly-gamma-glutamate synthesis protein (capsule biosynthesis protein)